jgi:hypothetical protein
MFGSQPLEGDHTIPMVLANRTKLHQKPFRCRILQQDKASGLPVRMLLDKVITATYFDLGLFRLVGYYLLSCHA